MTKLTVHGKNKHEPDSKRESEREYLMFRELLVVNLCNQIRYIVMTLLTFVNYCVNLSIYLVHTQLNCYWISCPSHRA